MYRLFEAPMFPADHPFTMSAKAEVPQASKWATRFMLATIIQGALAIGLTAWLLYSAVFGVPAASKIVAGGSAGTWLTVGYLGYLIAGLVATAGAAFFYQFIEVRLRKPLKGFTNALAWAHLFLWNIGVVGATWLMMHAGFRGGAAQLSVANGGLGWTGAQAGLVHSQIMAAYPPYIAVFFAVALLGALLGLAGFAVTFARPAKAVAPTQAAAEP